MLEDFLYQISINVRLLSIPKRHTENSLAVGTSIHLREFFPGLVCSLRQFMHLIEVVADVASTWRL